MVKPDTFLQIMEGKLLGGGIIIRILAVYIFGFHPHTTPQKKLSYYARIQRVASSVKLSVPEITFSHWGRRKISQTDKRYPILIYSCINTLENCINRPIAEWTFDHPIF